MAMTREDNQRGALRAAEVKRERAIERARKWETMAELVDYTEREQIGPELLKHAISLIRQASAAQVEANSASDVRHLAEAGKIIHGMARLEFGESTSNVAHASVQDRMAQRAELEARLAALSEDDAQDS